VYARTHNRSGTPASAIGTHGSHEGNGVLALFAGLVVVDIANVVLLLTLGSLGSAEAPAARGEEAKKAQQRDVPRAVSVVRQETREAAPAEEERQERASAIEEVAAAV
jgi:hypothetical protein